MLDFLNILNGNLSPEFDKLNNEYTVFVSSETSSLVIEYIAEDGYFVDIIGNDSFESGENIVQIMVTDEIGSIDEYKIIVNKSEEESAFDENASLIALEAVAVDNPPTYLAPLSASIIFLIILGIFKIMFLSKKNAKKR